MRQEKTKQVEGANRKKNIKVEEPQFIEKLKMESIEDILHIKIKIKGLWKKNYSLIIHDNQLMISAMCGLTNNSKFITHTTSLLLPEDVYNEKVWSDVLNGELHIIVAKQKTEDIGNKQENYEEINLNELRDRLGVVFKN